MTENQKLMKTQQTIFQELIEYIESTPYSLMTSLTLEKLDELSMSAAESIYDSIPDIKLEEKRDENIPK